MKQVPLPVLWAASLYSLPEWLQIQGIHRTLKDIKFITERPGGLLHATKHITTIATKYAEFMDGRNEEILKRGREMFDLLDITLSRIVAARWMTLSDLKSNNVERTPQEMLSCLEYVDDKFVKLGHRGDGDFKESVAVLSCCRSRRLAHTKVMVAVGHTFPPELVDLIWEEVCLGKAMEFLRGPIVASWARG
ncbi:hypothetical protein LTR27_009032 [Elasticomyces elasticus]|nr:hypothetical protein LTR27_009032 [Elasticomyces elasticus]